MRAAVPVWRALAAPSAAPSRSMNTVARAAEARLDPRRRCVFAQRPNEPSVGLVRHSLRHRSTLDGPDVGDIHKQPRHGQYDSTSDSDKQSSSHTSNNADQKRASWFSRMRSSWKKTPVRWTPLPIAGGIALLAAINLWKQSDMHVAGPDFRDGTYDHTKDNLPTVKGPWQVHVIGALPLRTISRIYGALNSYTLPVWFRVPGYKLYSWIFGVNLAECEPEDLKEYQSMSDFFLRKLKPGARPIADDFLLVSPADGRVVNFGYIENRRVEQVKGVSYSLDALLSGSGTATTSIASNPTQAPASASSSASESDNATVDEQQFANLNGLHYTVDQLMGAEPHNNQSTHVGGPQQQSKTPERDASITTHQVNDQDEIGPASASTRQSSLTEQISLASETFDPASPHWTLRGVPKEGNKMFFAVIYLAPGDYHRFHSPTNWIVERRRHFAGELFSVSPYMTRLLSDLFVLNERVALLGRWRHGFFGFVPVGATNVGSIRINFDADLRTNSPERPKVQGDFSEATYAGSSTLLQGKPCVIGEEMGGFMLGSTIVLVFEAPASDFQFCVSRGQKVKVGEPLGDRRPKVAELLLDRKAKEMRNV